MARKLRYKDQEGDMAKAELQKIEMYAAKLNDMIHPDDELEAWVQSKLSRVATDLGDVFGDASESPSGRPVSSAVSGRIRMPEKVCFAYATRFRPQILGVCHRDDE